MKVRITLSGTAPLLMHNARLSNPVDPIVKELRKYTSKRKKTDADHEMIARLTFEGGLYFDPELGPYLPGQNIEASILGGARLSKAGKTIERGLFIIDNENPLLYDGPRTVKELWESQFFLSASVKIQRNRVSNTRPMFQAWAVEADAEIDPEVIDVDVLSTIVKEAGAQVGIGDWRPRYGRFTATITQL